MAYSSTEQRQFGLKLESSRGTAETAPSKWYPVDKDSSMSYGVNLLKDEALRGVPDDYPMIPGAKSGTGKIKMPLDAQMCGEFFKSLLGSVGSVQQGATIAYLHTITRDASSMLRPAYTFFLNYGNSIVKKYNLSVVKAITLTGVVEQLITMEADVLFKSEADGSIGTPAFPTQHYLGFQHCTFKLGGSSNTNVRSFQLKIDGGSDAFRTLNQSQDIADILARKSMEITGNFVIFFTNSTDRDNFLAGTQVALEFLIEGDIIASTYKHTVDLVLPKCQYTAYPFGDQDGLLAATANFKAVYDPGTSKSISALITNADVSY